MAKTGEDKSLTDKQEAFVQEYLKDENGTQAILRLPNLFKVNSDNAASTQASEYLRNPAILERLAIIRGAILDKANYGREELLSEYKALAHTNISDFLKNGAESEDGKTLTMTLIHFRQLPRELTRAVKQVKTKPNGEVEFTLYDKVKAMEGLGKHFGLFERDNLQKNKLGIDTTNLSPKELLVLNKILLKSQGGTAE